MTLLDLVSADEKQRVREVVSRHKLPAGVTGVTTEAGTDQNGDDALWLVFHLAPEYRTTPATYKALYDFAHAIRPELLDAGVEHWPHIRFQLAQLAPPDEARGSHD